MGKLFGTDGIRGIVGETLTADMAYRVGQAVATVLAEDKKSAPEITIGKDTRISSDMLESALIAGICSVGGNVVPLGVIPTPAVAYLTVQRKADAGIVISASHNPYEHNGIKVFNSRGYKLPDETEARVEALLLSDAPITEKTGSEIGTMIRGMREARENYIDHLCATIEDDLSGLRVCVDCANGAASATAPDLFRRFKARTDIMHAVPNGVNINNRCGSTHLESLQETVVNDGYDIGVAYDGDADRCLMVDEKGNIIDGDKIMAVCAMDMRRAGKLNGNAIVATVMSNLGLHEFCQREKIRLVCTDVGDRHVLEEMLACGYCIGGEQSGHMIYTEYATTGDGELTSLQFLQILKRSGKKASELVSCCAQYPQVLVNVPVASRRGVKEQIMASEILAAAIRKQEAKLGQEGRILLRPSGTEALIRVMVEAKTEEMAHFYAEELVNVVKSLKIS
ncbi:MAG: phosphoglucosamine mutase [Clostridiales bacterium]|nr:phosphoglucosamine mutase [bacterium 210917-SL.2.15]MCI5844136.1 phosphoglucosamine mutase [Clostridiales bacterium]MDY4035985.1 phosphoglucosamine mutase [Candidatus Pseudoscilispira sp.]